MRNDNKKVGVQARVHVRAAAVHLGVGDHVLTPAGLHPFQLLDQLLHKETQLQRNEVEAQLREEQEEVQGWERAAG